MKDFLKLIFFGISNSPRLEMISPENDETKQMPFGFNFQFLVFSGLFGLPLFFKRMWGWAWLMFSLSTVQFYLFIKHLSEILSAMKVQDYYALPQNDSADAALTFLLFLLAVLLAVKGNEWAVRGLLKKGWRFAHPDQDIVKKAAAKWKLSKHDLKPPRVSEKL